MNNRSHLQKLAGTLNKDDIAQISLTSLQILTDKPDDWEFFLLAELMNDYIKKCESIKKDMMDGVPLGEIIELKDPIEIMAWIQKHFKNLRTIIESLMRLLNDEIPIAVGKPGEPGDANHINSIAKRFIEGYKSIIEWRLKFLSLDVDPIFSKIIDLKSAVRVGLAPLVVFSWLALHYGFMVASAVLISMLTLLIGGAFLIIYPKKTTGNMS